MSTKVFVGNLSFKTQTEALREHFSAAGTVENANIITRGPRSLGYGFVDFKTAADAENAVKLFNQKEIDGRVVNVEVAHPRQEGAADGAASTSSPKPAGDRPPRAPRGGRGGRAPAASGEATGDNVPAPRRFRRRPQGENAGDESAPAAEGSDARGTGRPRGRGGFGRRGGRRGSTTSTGAPATNADGTPASPKPAGARPPRQPRERKPREAQPPKPQRPKELSQTTLFVANLPFAVTDAELAEIFSGLKVTKAHVVTKRNGKSKGFGFVEFANQEDQLAALKAKDNSVYQERPLNVKVALVQSIADAAAEKEAEGDAPKDAAPATETKTEETTESKPAEAGSA